MRKYILTILAAACMSLAAFAQTDAMEEQNRLAVSVETPEGIKNENAAASLKNNITQALVLNGLSATESRFTTLVKVAELSKDMTSTAPVMYVTELEISLFIGDLYTGVVFGQTAFTVKGVAETEGKSYIEAIRNVKARNPKLRTMILSAKNKIMAYFDAEGDQIMNRIDALIAAGNYKAALIEINSIPRACTDLYNIATSRLAAIPASEAAKVNANDYDEILRYYYNGDRNSRIASFAK